VGVGQTETAVINVADTVVLVVQPGSGDVLQFLKAGVMEIPDLLVVNKADHGPTATRAASDLRVALAAIRQVGMDAEQAVLLASARDGLGISELVDALAAHRTLLGDLGVSARRRQGRTAWALDWLERRVGLLGIEALGGHSAVLACITAAVEGSGPPLAAAHALTDRLTVTARD
jgi:LAO/AO transport system kinase